MPTCLHKHADISRKITTSIVLLLGAASAGVASEKITPKQPFNGLYVGVFAGMGNRKVETSFDTSRIDQLLASYNLKGEIRYTKWRKFRGFIGGAFVGYGATQNQLYVGGELSAHYEDLNKKTNHHLKASASVVDPSSGLPVNININGDMGLTYKRSPVISPALRMGYTPDSDKLIYMRLGAEVSRDKLEEKHTTTVTVVGLGSDSSSDSESTKTSTKVTFVPGIGFEQAYGHCIFRVEYTYNFGASIKQKGGDDEVPATSKYTQHSLKLGLAYQF
jgi:opacity protein-like surface antigen